MRPYQRTAIGPRWNATGSNCGWTSMRRCARIGRLYKAYRKDSPWRRIAARDSSRKASPRSPNRAMLRAVGFGDGDFDEADRRRGQRPQHDEPVQRGHPAARRPRDEPRCTTQGAMPQVFGVPTVTDGIGMGTEGMKYSLVSREVIADAIETSVNGQCMDGVLVVGGCDKNMPGGMMAIARMNVPGDLRVCGHDQARRVEGTGAHHRVAVRGGGCVRRRRACRRKTTTASSATRAPRVGACGGMYTANTMSSSFEALGMSLLGLVADGLARRRESRLRRGVRARARAGDRERSQAARHHHAQVDRERDRARDGDRRLDQRRAALPGDRVGRGSAVDHRRLRAHPHARAGAVRPQALGQVRRGRLPSRGRRAAGAQDAARRQDCCTATA